MADNNLELFEKLMSKTVYSDLLASGPDNPILAEDMGQTFLTEDQRGLKKEKRYEQKIYDDLYRGLFGEEPSVLYQDFKLMQKNRPEELKAAIKEEQAQLQQAAFFPDEDSYLYWKSTGMTAVDSLAMAISDMNNKPFSEAYEDAINLLANKLETAKGDTLRERVYGAYAESLVSEDVLGHPALQDVLSDEYERKFVETVKYLNLPDFVKYPAVKTVKDYVESLKERTIQVDKFEQQLNSQIDKLANEIRIRDSRGEDTRELRLKLNELTQIKRDIYAFKVAKELRGISAFGSGLVQDIHIKVPVLGNILEPVVDLLFDVGDVAAKTVLYGKEGFESSDIGVLLSNVFGKDIKRDLQKAVEKYNREGIDALTPSELYLVAKALNKNMQAQLASNNPYRLGLSVGHSLEFMGMLGTIALGNGGSVLVNVADYAEAGQLLKGILQAGLQAGKGTIYAAPFLTDDVLEQQISNFAVINTDKGQYLFNMMDGTDGFWRAAIRTGYSTWVEMFTEQMGELLSESFIKGVEKIPGVGAAKDKAMELLAKDVFGKALPKMNITTPQALGKLVRLIEQGKKVLRWDDFLGEVLEEELGALLETPLTGDYKPVWSKEGLRRLLEESETIGILQFAAIAPQALAGLARPYQLDIRVVPSEGRKVEFRKYNGEKVLSDTLEGMVKIKGDTLYLDTSKLPTGTPIDISDGKVLVLGEGDMASGEGVKFSEWLASQEAYKGISGRLARLLPLLDVNLPRDEEVYSQVAELYKKMLSFVSDDTVDVSTIKKTSKEFATYVKVLRKTLKKYGVDVYENILFPGGDTFKAVTPLDRVAYQVAMEYLSNDKKRLPKSASKLVQIAQKFGVSKKDVYKALKEHAEEIVDKVNVGLVHVGWGYTSMVEPVFAKYMLSGIAKIVREHMELKKKMDDVKKQMEAIRNGELKLSEKEQIEKLTELKQQLDKLSIEMQDKRLLVFSATNSFVNAVKALNIKTPEEYGEFIKTYHISEITPTGIALTVKNVLAPLGLPGTIEFGHLVTKKGSKYIWGTIDYESGVIMLNPKLLQAGDTVVNYVLAHEFGHFIDVYSKFLEDKTFSSSFSEEFKGLIMKLTEGVIKLVRDKKMFHLNVSKGEVDVRRYFKTILEAVSENEELTPEEQSAIEVLSEMLQSSVYWDPILRSFEERLYALQQTVNIDEDLKALLEEKQLTLNELFTHGGINAFLASKKYGESMRVLISGLFDTVLREAFADFVSFAVNQYTIAEQLSPKALAYFDDFVQRHSRLKEIIYQAWITSSEPSVRKGMLMYAIAHDLDSLREGYEELVLSGTFNKNTLWGKVGRLAREFAKKFIGRYVPYYEFVDEVENLLLKTLPKNASEEEKLLAKSKVKVLNAFVQRGFNPTLIYEYVEKYVTPLFDLLIKDGKIDKKLNLLLQEYLMLRRIAEDPTREGKKQPYALTQEQAKEMLEELNDILTKGGGKIDLGFGEMEITKDDADRLNKLIDGYDVLTKQILEIQHNAGLISDKYYESLKENNAYSRFQTIRYIKEYTEAKFYRVEGTFSGLGDILAETIKLLEASVKAAALNESKKALINLAMMGDAAVPAAIARDGSIKPPFNSDLDTLYFYENGVRYAYYVPKDLANLYKNYHIDNVVLQAYRRLVGLSAAAFTGLNPIFALGNIVKDIKTSLSSFLLGQEELLVKSGKKNVGEFLRNVVEGLKVGFLSATGKTEKLSQKQIDTLLEMKRLGAWSPTLVKITKDLLSGKKAVALEDIVGKYGVVLEEEQRAVDVLNALAKTDPDVANEIRKNSWIIKNKKDLKRFTKWFGRVSNLLSILPNATEIATKYAAYTTLTKDIRETDKMLIVANFVNNYVGTPSTVFGSPEMKDILGSMFIFYDVTMRLLYNNYRLLKKADNLSRFTYLSVIGAFVLPSVIGYLAKSGLLDKWECEQNNGKGCNRWQRAYAGVTSYDLDYFVVVPLPIGKNVAYIRIPTIPSVNIVKPFIKHSIAVLAYKELTEQGKLSTIKDRQEFLKALGIKATWDAFADFAKATVSLAPSSSPYVEIAANALKALEGETPRDWFTGKPIFTDYDNKTKAFVLWALDKAGIRTFVELERVDKNLNKGEPFLKAVIGASLPAKFIRSGYITWANDNGNYYVVELEKNLEKMRNEYTAKLVYEYVDEYADMFVQKGLSMDTTNERFWDNFDKEFLEDLYDKPIHKIKKSSARFRLQKLHLEIAKRLEAQYGRNDKAYNALKYIATIYGGNMSNDMKLATTERALKSYRRDDALRAINYAVKTNIITSKQARALEKTLY